MIVQMMGKVQVSFLNPKIFLSKTTYEVKQKQPTTQKDAHLPPEFSFVDATMSATPAELNCNRTHLCVIRLVDLYKKFNFELEKKKEKLQLITSAFVYRPLGQSMVISVPSSVIINASVPATIKPFNKQTGSQKKRSDFRKIFNARHTPM